MKQKIKDIHFRVHERGLYMSVLKRVMEEFGYTQHAKAVKHCIVNFLKQDGSGYAIIEDINAQCAFLGDNHIQLNQDSRENDSGGENQ